MDAALRALSELLESESLSDEGLLTRLTELLPGNDPLSLIQEGMARGVIFRDCRGRFCSAG